MKGGVGTILSALLSFQTTVHIGDAILQWCCCYSVIWAHQLQNAGSILTQSLHILSDGEQLQN